MEMRSARSAQPARLRASGGSNARRRDSLSLNVRGVDAYAQMERLAQEMAGMRLGYQDLLKPNGLESGARSLARISR